MLVECGISNPPPTYLHDGVVNNFTNVYKYDTSLFAKMLAVHYVLLCGHGGANDLSKKFFNFLFFKLSFEELNWVLEKASTYFRYENKNFYKLASFLQPFTTHRASYLEDKKQHNIINFRTCTYVLKLQAYILLNKKNDFYFLIL